MAKTPNLNLNVPDYRDLRWDIPVNENWNLIDAAVAGKQDSLTFDNAPVDGSENPVTSDGVYNALLNTGSTLSYTGTTLSLKNDNGTALSSVTIKSTPDLDNKTISLNTADELQTVGVINSRDNSTAIKTWTGTKAQYDAIVTKDPNTLYNITDDTDVSMTILEALYPIGSVYITYNNICPLQTLGVGTWTLESTGIVTNVDTNVPVIGNGMALGLTDGTINASPIFNTNTRLSVFTGSYGSSVGTKYTGSSPSTENSVGVTTDPTKSGIVGTVTRSVSTINIFRRIA